MTKEQPVLTAREAITEAVTILHKAGVSIQFNCFLGEFEIVEQDMKLDYALNCAKDCRVTKE